MKPLVLLFCISCLTSCSSTKQATEITPPQLLIQSPLPQMQKQVQHQSNKIDMKILIVEDGSVRFVELLNPSENTVWDSIVIHSIKQWKYSPAFFQNKPVRIWVRQTAIIRYAEPIFMTLGEIVCATTETADSAYNLLESGINFDDVVKQFSLSQSKNNRGIIGEINIRIYPKDVQKILLELEEEKFTAPVHFGAQYIIFKRMKDQKAM